jgi:hypothetical protein
MKPTRWFATMFVVFLFCLMSPTSGANQVGQEGKLIVRVLLGIDNAPARDAFVYIREDIREISRNISASSPGMFEISLPPGLYDVFVSEGSSLPICKRVEIKVDDRKIFTAKLEPDLEHLQN